jgi:hypothetical protein
MKSNSLEKAIKSKFGDWQGDFPELRVCCPFPECGDNRYRLGINVVKRVGHCFNCGLVLNSASLLDLVGSENIYEPTDYESVEQDIVDLERTDVKNPEFTGEIEVPGIDIASLSESGYSQTLRPEFQRAMEYLESRNLNPVEVSEAHRFQIPFPGSYLKNRLILPVYEGQKMVYWQARSLTDAKPKYINPPRSECPAGKSQFVFNLDTAANYEEVLICEGIFSAISCGPAAVAIFGKELSDAQTCKIIKKRVRKVVIVLDPGEEEASRKIARKLQGRLEIRIAHLRTGDPNQISQQELEDRLNFAEPFEDLDFSL